MGKGKEIFDVPVLDRLIARSEYNPETGCWIWNGARDDKNYGLITVSHKRARMVHQASWEVTHGAIPAGLEIDHLCHTQNPCGLDQQCQHRPCWAVEHLEIVTHRENCRRGESPVGINARKTHCHRGHELAGANIRIYGNRRYCKPCRSIWSKERRDLRRSVSGSQPPAVSR